MSVPQEFPSIEAADFPIRSYSAEQNSSGHVSCYNHDDKSINNYCCVSIANPSTNGKRGKQFFVGPLIAPKIPKRKNRNLKESTFWMAVTALDGEAEYITSDESRYQHTSEVNGEGFSRKTSCALTSKKISFDTNLSHMMK